MSLLRVAALSLLLAGPAAAQTRPASRPPPAKPAAPPPAEAAAPAPDPQSLFGESWRMAVLVGLDLGEGDTAFKARADLETSLYRLAPRTMLSGLISAGYMRGGEDPPAQTLFGITTDAKATSDVFELVPAVRVGYALLPRLGVHADAGIGFYYVSTSAKVTTSGGGLPPLSVSASDNGFGAVIRLAGGAAFEVSPNASVAAEVLGINWRRGDGSATTVSILMGVSFKL